MRNCSPRSIQGYFEVFGTIIPQPPVTRCDQKENTSGHVILLNQIYGPCNL